MLMTSFGYFFTYGRQVLYDRNNQVRYMMAKSIPTRKARLSLESERDISLCLKQRLKRKRSLLEART